MWWWLKFKEWIQKTWRIKRLWVKDGTLNAYLVLLPHQNPDKIRAKGFFKGIRMGGCCKGEKTLAAKFGTREQTNSNRVSWSANLYPKSSVQKAERQLSLYHRAPKRLGNLWCQVPLQVGMKEWLKPEGLVQSQPEMLTDLQILSPTPQLCRTKHHFMTPAEDRRVSSLEKIPEAQEKTLPRPFKILREIKEDIAAMRQEEEILKDFWENRRVLAVVFLFLCQLCHRTCGILVSLTRDPAPCNRSTQP